MDTDPNAHLRKHWASIQDKYILNQQSGMNYQSHDDGPIRTHTQNFPPAYSYNINPLNSDEPMAYGMDPMNIHQPLSYGAESLNYDYDIYQPQQSHEEHTDYCETELADSWTHETPVQTPMQDTRLIAQSNHNIQAEALQQNIAQENIQGQYSDSDGEFSEQDNFIQENDGRNIKPYIHEPHSEEIGILQNRRQSSQINSSNEEIRHNSEIVISQSNLNSKKTVQFKNTPDESNRHRKGTLQYPNEGGNCQTCMSRVPFATLIATIMCVMGVGVFCGTMYRGSTTTLRMFEDVFKIKVKWVEPVQLTFMTVGAVMGGLGLMILFVGCLSTGDTRAKVYRTWRGRVGGRISCAVFMTIAYILTLIWILILCFLIFVTLLYTLAWLQCTHLPKEECIDYNQFGFLFPEGTLEEDKRICPGEKKIFCKDHVNNAEVIFIVATLSAFLVILSLIHYLMCLSANYAHIKSQEKFSELQDLQDMQFLNESEMSTLPKDRF